MGLVCKSSSVLRAFSIELLYSIVGMTVGGGHGPQRNQPKIIFRNNLRPFGGIGQA